MSEVCADTFRAWLDSAKLGDEMVWHVGDLTSDVSEGRSRFNASALVVLMEEVVEAHRAGRVKLFQRPLPVKGFAQHLARRIA